MNKTFEDYHKLKEKLAKEDKIKRMVGISIVAVIFGLYAVPSIYGWLWPTKAAPYPILTDGTYSLISRAPDLSLTLANLWSWIKLTVAGLGTFLLVLKLLPHLIELAKWIVRYLVGTFVDDILDSFIGYTKDDVKDDMGKLEDKIMDDKEGKDKVKGEKEEGDEETSKAGVVGEGAWTTHWTNPKKLLPMNWEGVRLGIRVGTPTGIGLHMAVG